LSGTFAPGEDIRGQAYTFLLDEPLTVQKGQTLYVTLSTNSPGVRLVLHAPNPALESTWDDAIPYPTDGFYAYDVNGGIYRGDLNFEMYWPDNELKLKMFETQLDEADYIFITSSRQWGTTTRVPERYLLTTFYYRNLLGCPEGEDIEWCYGVAEPGMFEGILGFELVETFDSNPTLGPIEINDQASEEAFTVYDHAKVLIFKKTDAYDPIAVRELLRSVDLTQVVYFTPGDASDYQAVDPETADDPENTLMLPEDQWEAQQKSGTWSELFDRESLLNTSQPLAVIAFYGLVLVLGLLCYPLVRMALPGLADKGYPLSKLAGLLILSFVVWILGSFGVPFTRTTIWLVLLGLAVFSGVLIFLQRRRLAEELRANWRYFLTVEILALVAFVFFLLVRLGNPDLWHPYKGGEKPMDFSFLNAVLKSTSFPPYNPWFAGSYINYYYYGFVIAGVPIKLLGIVPSVAYNIILPIWYSLMILGGFSVGWNLYSGLPRSRALRAGEPRKQRFLGTAFWVGLATAIGLALLGNLGTVKLIITGFQQLAAGGATLSEAALGQKITWTLQGFVQFLRGTPMPFYPGDWYWYPSRVIPGEPITEFPYFTFLYGDPHAHLFAFPITVLAISWCLSVVLHRAHWGEADGRLKVLGTIIGFGFGALAIGALQPTNTWDFYTYIILASIALFYAMMQRGEFKFLTAVKIPGWIRKIVSALLVVGLFVLLTMLLYQPFSHWFGQGYTKIELWEGDRTPLSSYFTHWGLFLFIILSWMAWETYHWMKTTPESDLKKLAPYKTWLYAGLIVFLIVLLALLVQGVVVALVVLPVGVWAIVLMFRPGRSDGHRFLLFLIGTAIFLTLVVELIYLSGDIGRMNTVFKFYLQAWIMLALSSGVCLVWTFQSLKYWKPRLELVWQALLFVLVVSAALFPLLGTTDKIHDRMADGVPTTLDGMAYMQYATYYDMGMDMQLEQDYEAILWMQENVEGSPVILEGQAYEYRWGNRFSIYTGLPGVVGWNWHQRQQRAILGNNEVQERVDAVGTFYLTLDMDYVRSFIDRYEVGYIVVGQLEAAFYPGDGLNKFETYNGILWEEVFRTGQTVIYKVLD
jgi:YYY domain-containing protein